MPYLLLAVVGLFLFVQLLRYWIAVYTFLGIRFQRASCTPAVEGDIPPETAALLSAGGADLEKQGFEFSHSQIVDEIFVSGYSKKPVMVFRHNAACAYAEISLSDTLDLYNRYSVEFVTAFSDGTSLSTLNGLLHGVMGRYPGKTLQDTYSEHIEVQWEAHRKKAEELRRSGKTPVLFSPEEYVHYAEDSMNRYAAALIEDGWLRRADGEAYHRMGFVPAVKAAHSYLGGEGKLRALRQKRIKLAPPEGWPTPVPVELEVRNFYRNLELVKGPGLKGLGKAALLVVTLILFAFSFRSADSSATVWIIIGALFIHELGHLLAMRACGYRDTKILFLPFLGAATVGAEQNPKAFKRVIVSFSGPLPGILLGVLILALAPQPPNRLILEIGGWLLALNYLNLLPIMPFDGGQIFNVFFTRMPFLQVVFLAVSGLVLILAGIGTKTTILSVIGVVMFLQIRFVLLKTQVLKGLRTAGPDKNAVIDEPTFLAAIFLKLREKAYRKMSFAEKFTMVKNLKETESFTLQVPSWRLILTTLLVYLLLFGAPIFIAVRLVGPFMRMSKATPPGMSRQKILPPDQIVLTPADQALVAQLGFDAEIALRVKKTCQGDLEQLAGMDDKGNVTKAPGLVVTVPKTGAEELVDGLRADLKTRGYLAFLVKKNYGGAPDKIALLKGVDPYAILSIMQTNGANYEVTTKDIIARLKEWEKKSSFDITGADFDWVQIRFTVLPSELNAFAEEVYKFCPDSVDQGAGDVKKLAEEIQRTRTLFLWWD